MTRMRFAVVGDPIAHSRSPAMHAAAFRALGLGHSYEAVRATAAEIEHVIGALRKGDFDGLNITVPHKTRVLTLVDEVTPEAARIGAANTLVRVGQRVVAHNTDAPALAAELRALAGCVPHAPAGSARALVLGNGGAARAARVALEQGLGLADVVVRARHPRDPSEQRWAPTPASEASTLFVVQATSAGMTDPAEGAAGAGDAVAQAVAWDALPADAVALDVVYAPATTPFLLAARARGLRCANGIGMLVGQGALAFELWLGIAAPAAEMRAAVEVLS